MSILNNSLLLGAPAGATTYQVSRSLRFNAPDSSHLYRSFNVTGNRKTWTWAGWVKTVRTGFNEYLFMGTRSSDTEGFLLNTNNKLQFYLGTSPDANLITTQIFQDHSGWRHIQVAVNTTQITARDRIKIYVNGSQVTAFGTEVYPSQNYDCSILNTNTDHNAAVNFPAFLFSSFYLADIYFIDGLALDPSSFTTTDPTTGQLIPIAYSGSYGTNGFHLPFSDNSATTATTLGKDTSGNGNNWSCNNFSVTAGAGNDSLVDTPTSYGTDTGAGGEVRGNYATLNPLQSSATLSNGNLDCSTTSTSWQANVGTIFQSSGKWYAEFTVSNVGAGGIHIGIVGPNYSVAAGNYIGNTATSYAYRADGTKFNNATQTSYGASYTTNDVIGVAMDLDAGTLVFYKNGVSQGTAYSSMTGEKAFAVSVGSTTGTHSVVLNFGQRPFAYPVSGFKALCDTNLPEGTITTSGTFTGNASSDGPFVWLNGVPTAMTINSNAVTFGTHADKLANGFKLRTNSTSYNTSGSNSYSITTTGAKFKYARAQANP